MLNDVVEDVRRLAKVGRTKIQKQKSLADIMFLIALLVGGPVMTVGGDVQTGLFIVLAGGLSSTLRRYSSWSTPGTVSVGSVLALIGATLLVDTAPTPDEVLAAEAARAAYVSALSDLDPDVLVETRGVGHIAVWFNVSDGSEVECGLYPDEPVRRHLGELGFRRVVVAGRNQAGGLCSFRP